MSASRQRRSDGDRLADHAALVETVTDTRSIHACPANVLDPILVTDADAKLLEDDALDAAGVELLDNEQPSQGRGRGVRLKEPQ